MGARRPFSLATRLTAAYAAGAFALALGLTVALDLALESGLRRDLRSLAKREAVALEAILLEEREPAHALAQATRRLAASNVSPRVVVRVQAADGTVIAESPEMAREFPAPVGSSGPGAAASGESFARDAALRRPVPPVLADAKGALESASGATWQWRRRVVRRGEEVSVVEVAVDGSAMQSLLGRFRAGAAGALAGALAVCILGAHVLARRGVRPIEAVTEAARRVSARTLGERLDLAGAPEEIARLARTFNEMLERLDGAFQRLKETGQDLAHELRTPLQNLRGEAEVALLAERAPQEYRRVLEAMVEECARLGRLIDDILLIERVEARPAACLALQRFDLAAEVRDLCDYFEPGAASRGLSLRCEAEAAVPIQADRLKLRRALANLVDNALKYTPEGGRVTVWVRPLAHCGAEVGIRDTGIGMSEDELRHAFERFFRADRSRSRATGGSGLGLAIARALVRAHGGEIGLDSRPGLGTTATVRLPGRTSSASSETAVSFS